MRLRAWLLSAWMLAGCEKASDVGSADFTGANGPPRSAGGGAGNSGDTAGSSGGDSDGGLIDPSEQNCTFAFASFDVPVETPTRQAFAVSTVENEIVVAYLVPACGGVFGSATRLGLRTVSLLSTGEIVGPEVRVGFGGNECFATRDPALVQNQLFYVADSRGFQINRIDLSAETPFASEVTGELSVLSQALDAVVLGEQTLLFWATTRDASGVSEIQVFQPDESTPLAAILLPEDQQRVLNLSAAAIGTGSGQLQRTALTWVSEWDETASVFARVIDEDAQASLLVQLASRAGSQSSVDVATRALGGGAAVYAVLNNRSRYELRFRRINTQGTFGSEVRLASDKEDLLDPTIAPFARGYVIAARAVSSGAAAQIRLTFVDENGQFIRTQVLESVSANPSRIRVRTAVDGRLFLVWTDISDTGTTLHARRISCSSIR